MSGPHRNRPREFQHGYAVDVAELLFTPERDFLVKNNKAGTGTVKVKGVDLEGKTIVLVISPLYDLKPLMKPWDRGLLRPECTRDMVESYEQLVPLGAVEFVSVPLHLLPDNTPDPHSEALYNHLLSTMPWPALPFHDVGRCGARVAETFSFGTVFMTPYWVIIDPTRKVVSTRSLLPYLFKIFCGSELHPLSLTRVRTLQHEFDPWAKCHGTALPCACKARKRVIDNWDQYLASPTRNFLLATNSDKVPISSLHDKVIGLYFCENIPHPPRMELIKRVYNRAKKRGYAFEIVQISFHYHFFNALYTQGARLDEELHSTNIPWLRLPFKDPSCRKLQRMFKCNFDDEDNSDWQGDCLVIIDPRKANENAQVLFEFCGAEIFKKYGIQAYPFTRPSLFETQRAREIEELRLEKLFPPGSCSLERPACNGSDVVEVSQLTGQRVLVLFGDADCLASQFVSMLKSKYRDQDNENKFEVVYVPVDYDESSSDQYIEDMPWVVVRPHRPDFGPKCRLKIIKYGRLDTGVAAFDESGLIAKEGNFPHEWGKEEPDKFPFVSQDWEGWIKLELQPQFDMYHNHIHS